MIAVIKVGGDIVADDTHRRDLCNNIKSLRDEGIQVVLLHGGGPQVTALQERLKMKVNKIGGRRITSPEDLRVVTQAICGEVNTQLTADLRAVGVDAFGCHGASGALIQAVRRPPRVVSGSDGKEVDFGEVGDVKVIRADLLRKLFELGLVPVVATLGVSEEGTLFNINADTTVVKIAASLRAEALLMVTAIGGIFRDIDDPKTKISKVTEAEARGLISEGVIQGGMIPKVEEAMTVFESGVRVISIMGPSGEGEFARAVSGTTNAGTQIVRNSAAI